MCEKFPLNAPFSSFFKLPLLFCLKYFLHPSTHSMLHTWQILTPASSDLPQTFIPLSLYQKHTPCSSTDMKSYCFVFGHKFHQAFLYERGMIFQKALHSNMVDFFIGFSKVLRSLCKLCPSLQRNTHMLFYQFQIIYDILILHSPLWPSLHKTENISRFRQIKRPPQEEETRTSLTLRLFYRVTVKEISNIFWLLLPFVLLNKCR